MHRVPFARPTHLWMLAALALACGDNRTPARMSTEEGGIVGDGSAPPLDAGAGNALDAGPGLPDVQVVILPDSGGAAPATEAGSEAGAVSCAASGTDRDGDGFSVADGDCDDCNAYVNPRAFDLAGNGVDEDCSGRPDDESDSCESNLAPEADNAEESARSLGLCRKSDGKSWGLVRAAWMFPDGTTASLSKHLCPAGLPPAPLSHSILGAYGPRVSPRSGPTMLVLSTGIARPGVIEVPVSAAPAYGTSPNNALMCRFSRAPEGFPRNAPSCPNVVASTDRTATDGMALELTIAVPSNAVALSFDFDFYSTEFPNYVCSEKNDHFVALLTSKHANTPADKNISFDAKGNVVNVNSGFMAVCRPGTINGHSFACPRGEAELEGTGLGQEMVNEAHEPYLEGGATGWLRTQAAVVPGEAIVLRLAIWDTADSAWDSTVLLDNFTWILKEQPTVTPPSAPITEPIILL